MDKTIGHTIDIGMKIKSVEDMTKEINLVLDQDIVEYHEYLDKLDGLGVSTVLKPLKDDNLSSEMYKEELKVGLEGFIRNAFSYIYEKIVDLLKMLKRLIVKYVRYLFNDAEEITDLKMEVVNKDKKNGEKLTKENSTKEVVEKEYENLHGDEIVENTNNIVMYEDVMIYLTMITKLVSELEKSSAVTTVDYIRQLSGWLSGETGSYEIANHHSMNQNTMVVPTVNSMKFFTVNGTSLIETKKIRYRRRDKLTMSVLGNSNRTILDELDVISNTISGVVDRMDEVLSFYKKTVVVNERTTMVMGYFHKVGMEINSSLSYIINNFKTEKRNVAKHGMKYRG